MAQEGSHSLSPSPGANSPLQPTGSPGNVSGSMLSREHRSASIGHIVHRSDSQESLSDERSEGQGPPAIKLPNEVRERAGTGPPSPKDDSRSSPLKDGKRASPSPLKEKRSLSQRLSAKIFGSAKANSGKPASYYRDLFKKKAISKPDVIALQDEFRSQQPAWMQKFDEEATPHLEAFLHHINARNERSDTDIEILSELFRAIAIVAQPTMREYLPGIFKPQFLHQVVSQLSNKQMRLVILTVCSELCDGKKDGVQLLLTTLEHYAKSKDLSSRFIPITQCFAGAAGSTYDTPIELKLATMTLLNQIFTSLEDIEQRFTLRTELVNLGFQSTMKELMAASQEELTIQIDTFEEGMTDDYHMMLSRKKNVRALAAVKKTDATHRPKNYFRVYMVNTAGVASSVVIPFAEKKTVTDLIGTITNKHPVANVSLYGISVEKEGASIWLEEEHKCVMEDYALSGEVIAEFKLKPWTITVLSPDGSPHLFPVDPYITVGDFMSQLTSKFSLPTTEEYSLMLSANNANTWLLENKPIHSVGPLYDVGHVLQLQTKPKPLKVYRLKEDTCEIVQITGNSSVLSLLKQLAAKFGVSESCVREYGLVPHKGDTSTYYDEGRTLAACNLADGMGAVRFVMRAVRVSVDVPTDGSTKTFSIFRHAPVKQAIGEIAEHLKIDVDEGYSLYSKPEGSEPQLLEDWKTLAEQGVEQSTGLALRKDASKKKKDWFTDSGVPIWEERSDSNVVYSESKPPANPSSGVDMQKSSSHPPKKEISCASLNQLVEYLTSEKEHDMDFVKAFLLTYRSFTTPEIFLTKLGERWLCPSSVDKGRQQVIKLRICTTITQWLDRIDDAAVLDLIGPFVQTQILPEHGFESLGNRLKKTVEERKISAKQRVYNYQTPPPPTIPPRAPEPWMTLFDIDEMEVARQLTLPLFELYSRIKPAELFNQAWNSPKLRHRSPNVCAVIDYFNKVATWSATCLLQESTLANRSRMLKQLIMISQALRQLNNLHLLTAIISGLSNSAVLRLKWTRLKLPKQVLKIMEDLEALTNMEGSYRVFRRELEHVVLPCIPYVGVYLTDLTFIEDGNPDMKGDLINWDKRKLVHNIIAQIQKFQMVGYNLTKETAVDRYLQDQLTKAPLHFKDDREMYAKSLQLEPRNAKREDIK